jgi:D-beta-D-heptose 7-phosphate kinase/D-beta-D-heptose 1-phosphate adenosyltransferase
MSRLERPAAAKVLGPTDLQEALREERRRGRKVVFTNGCFDLLHTGHLRLLEAAAALGELLVVGLNHDDSVRRLKGPNRPFQPFEERAELLAGLQAVDYVVGFGEDTPAALIDAIVPDILVKGGDWALDEIVGRETVESAGGRVVTVQLVAGQSTTNLVQKIRAT